MRAIEVGDVKKPARRDHGFEAGQVGEGSGRIASIQQNVGGSIGLKAAQSAQAKSVACIARRELPDLLDGDACFDKQRHFLKQAGARDDERLRDVGPEKELRAGIEKFFRQLL